MNWPIEHFHYAGARLEIDGRLVLDNGNCLI